MTTSFTKKEYSLIFCRRKAPGGENEVLLGMKKRGFGVGKWNGYGGKLEENESMDDCVKRELEEECLIKANKIKKMGICSFRMLETSKIMNVHIYETWDFNGEAVETDEMRPRWFGEQAIPFESMWPDDPYWLPKVLEGKTISGNFDYSNEETIIYHNVVETADFEQK